MAVRWSLVGLVAGLLAGTAGTTLGQVAGATRADAGPLLLVTALANLGVAAVYSGIGAVSAALDNPALLLVASLWLPVAFVAVTSLASRRADHP